MISIKQTPPKPKNDDYARLANYIADASRKGEKCLASWSAGCLAGDDYQLGISEVLATQACNERTKKEKTYHLVVSFRPEDEEKLTFQDYKDIEERFAEILGFEQHQRHCGVHIDTANPHLHVAYNMIHPEKKTRLEPFRDYWKRDDLCRKLEKEYGVSVDPGRAHRKEFMHYLSTQKENYLPAVKAARTWEHVHAAMAESGLKLVCKDHVHITPLNSEMKGCRIAGQEIHASLNKSELIQRFGSYKKKEKFYEPKSEFTPVLQEKKNDRAEAIEAYTGEESFVGYLQRHKDIIDKARITVNSWEEFQKTLQAELNVTVKLRGRGTVFADLTKVKGKKSTQHAKVSDLGRDYSRQKLEQQFGKIQPLPFGSFVKPKRQYHRDPLHRHPERWKLMKEYKAGIDKRKGLFDLQKEQRQKKMQELRLKWNVKIKKYKIDSRLSWKEKRYLVSAAKAEQLRHEEELRSKFAEERKNIKEEVPYSNWNDFLRQKAEAGSVVALAILQSSKQQSKSTFKERKVEKLLEGMTYAVDNEGNITYTLKDGGKVVDYGKEIIASKGDEARKFAEKLRGRRFGRKEQGRGM
ncbi:relaxase/mobilization nuclease domain-containing protein [Halodesulfovibrio sp.]|uniref:relaxase/mobilization nuclease domain-containing protein n=1 Tax=Halodesulfovibrio sp. TaxID=1912772 RepID=UPI0025D1D79D|nr:relaxase/mobilization nuclease domain-containing protein [Halodesulfovibrio sp.]MCT4533728.1 relaxase/mobilization nuclease domain-containing protein [Halodesulfovibrio sp.]